MHHLVERPRPKATIRLTALGGPMFAVGEPVTAMDRTGEWLDGRVVAARGKGDALELQIHFSGWSKEHGEWLRAVGGKVQSRDTLWSRSSLS